jgi:hypothetical protein
MPIRRVYLITLSPPPFSFFLYNFFIILSSSFLRRFFGDIYFPFVVGPLLASSVFISFRLMNLHYVLSHFLLEKQIAEQSNQNFKVLFFIFHSPVLDEIMSFLDRFILSFTHESHTTITKQSLSKWRVALTALYLQC